MNMQMPVLLRMKANCKTLGNFHCKVIGSKRYTTISRYTNRSFLTCVEFNATTNECIGSINKFCSYTNYRPTFNNPYNGSYLLNGLRAVNLMPNSGYCVPVRCVTERASDEIRSFLSEQHNIAEDTIVYSNHKNNLKFLPFLGLVQLIIMSYFSYFLYENLRDLTPSSDDAPLTGWRRLNFGNKKFKGGLIFFFSTMGHALCIFSFFYVMRTIRSITLLKGGRNVKITTLVPFYKDRTMDIPLSHLSAMRSRQDPSHMITMKVKGHALYFFVDKSGIFHNESLFDYHVALSRSFKK